LLQTNTNTSIQTSNAVIISKKREEGISDPEHKKREEVPKTVNGNYCQSMAESRGAEVVIPMQN
jgi:hypothetical protein